MELQKMYMKSNQLCSICGKYIENYRECYASKTKRKNYVVAHINCIKRSI